MVRTGTDKSNVAELADLSENFPVPYENSTLWANTEIIWSPHLLNGNAKPSQEDLAVNMASAGYYRLVSAFVQLYIAVSTIEKRSEPEGNGQQLK